MKIFSRLLTAAAAALLLLSACGKAPDAPSQPAGGPESVSSSQSAAGPESISSQPAAEIGAAAPVWN
ncbi:MAG: hypothetical protein PHD67_04260, partial [Oscillospiraceae bacterium]|nr:hypothetical protein [Oscillospiraceae bacterium]